VSGSVNDNQERREIRREERLRALGTRDPRCSYPGCLEGDPFALIGTHPRILCYEHLADAIGRSWVEGHHAQGKHNDPDDVVDTPANDHGVLSNGLQPLWPRETLRNPDGSPLLHAAAAIRGWLDILRLIIERTVGWVPPFLEALDAWLSERLGERWWNAFKQGGD
jgi:hypothetical protein